MHFGGRVLVQVHCYGADRNEQASVRIKLRFKTTKKKKNGEGPSSFSKLSNVQEKCTLRLYLGLLNLVVWLVAAASFCTLAKLLLRGGGFGVADFCFLEPGLLASSMMTLSSFWK